MPTLSHAMVVTLRLVDRGTEGFDAKFKYFLGATAFGCLLMIVSTYFFIHYIEGIVFTCIAIVFVYVCTQAFIYITNDNNLNPKLKMVNYLLMICCIVASAVYAGISDDMTTYEGATISCFAWLFFLWLYAMFMFALDY